uniref:WGS project CAEQ00000000 data, annotated contig 1577 n=1 Tax=Trypanosoma congolense (strain IL3000) TaxID=1068625 RepID=F9W778_TRYCI|nr:unnamed protein product [Trypanosoma congolense IL3000]
MNIGTGYHRVPPLTQPLVVGEPQKLRKSRGEKKKKGLSLTHTHDVKGRRANERVGAEKLMGAREELMKQLSNTLSEIGRCSSSNGVAVEARLLGAVADYIESGAEAESTLRSLRDALLRMGDGSAEQAAVRVKKEDDDITKDEKKEEGDTRQICSTPVMMTRKEMGMQRAQQLLSDTLLARYGQ